MRLTREMNTGEEEIMKAESEVRGREILSQGMRKNRGVYREFMKTAEVNP